jgi:apolipoprotein D and lipocalin family protein
MKKSMLGVIVLLAGQALSQNKSPERLNVVDTADLIRYSGIWYEIARLPNRFQDDCISDVTATYSLLEDGDIKVVNRCLKEDGEFSEVEGRARRANNEGPISKLKVRFAPAFLSFLPFVWGNYWILDLAADYSYAVIGEPGREYLWVLGRSPVMEDGKLDWILDRAKMQGYKVDGLIRTTHTRSGH